jgi:hypothetical protein
VKNSPPILGGAEAHEGFGGVKNHAWIEAGSRFPRSTTPEGLRALSPPPDRGGEFFHTFGVAGDVPQASLQVLSEQDIP